MSVAPRFPSEMGYAGLRMTADEYLSLGETHERYELIDGVVVMSPSPTPKHQWLIGRILFQLGAWDAGRDELIVLSETDLQLSSSTVYRPDACVYRRDRFASLPHRLTEPPELVLEALSPGSKSMDFVTKREDYERFGVGEYWIADPADARFRAWHRVGTQLIESVVDGDRLASKAIPGFVLDIGAIRRQLATL